MIESAIRDEIARLENLTLHFIAFGVGGFSYGVLASRMTNSESKPAQISDRSLCKRRIISKQSRLLSVNKCWCVCFRQIRCSCVLRVFDSYVTQLLEGILESFRLKMPPHNSATVREYLNEAFKNRWIGRGGSIAWPPRSPDLTSLDFFLWGYLKSVVYETPVESREDLVDRIFNAADAVRAMPNIFTRVQESLCNRYRTCLVVGGRNFEHFL